MQTIETNPVVHPSAWYGHVLAHDTSGIVTLTPAELEEIDTALQSVRQRSLQLPQIDRAAFPLPTLQTKLARVLTEIEAGRGFVVLRGLPVARYSDEDVGKVFWGIGTYLGLPVKQNPRGDLLGHVFDQGSAYGGLDVRGYETRAHLPFHTDGCDLVGLLCLRQARSGGLSSIVSAITIHNEILRRDPASLAPLYRGFHYIRREAALTEQPVTPHRVPVFGARDGVVSCRLIRNQINAAASIGTALDAEEIAALDLFDSLAADPAIHLDMDLQAGDMQLCNNYAVLHSRTEFDDFPEPQRRRHMIRLWLTKRERRPLAKGFAPQNGYGGLVETALASGQAA